MQFKEFAVLSVPRGGTGQNGVAKHLVFDTDVQTITNKRLQPRVSSFTTTTSLTPNIDNASYYLATALASNITINAVTGTPFDGEHLLIVIKDNGTTRTITWTGGAGGFQGNAIGPALITATVANHRLKHEFVFVSTDNQWELLTSGNG